MAFVPYVFSLAVYLLLVLSSSDEESPPLLDVTLLLDPESLLLSEAPPLELSQEEELDELDEEELEELLESSESYFISSSYYAFVSSSGFSCYGCGWPPFFLDFLANLCAYLGRLSHITKLSLWFSAMACS